MSPFLVRPPDDSCGRHAIRRQGPAIGLRHAARRPFASSPLEVGQRAPLPRSAAGRPLTPPVGAGRDRPSGARASPAPRQSRTLVGLSRGLGRPGVGGSRWWPDHHRWLPGDLDHRGWPYGRALNSSTLTLITLARRPITATGRASSPHRSRFCDSHSAPPNGDHHFPHSCTMRCERHPPVASAAALLGVYAARRAPGTRECRCVECFIEVWRSRWVGLRRLKSRLSRCGGAGGSRQPRRAVFPDRPGEAQRMAWH